MIKRVHFFALRGDIQSVAEDAEALLPLKYIRMGLFRSQGFEALTTALRIPDLGLADTASAITCASYLVCEQTTPVSARQVRQKDGSVLYAIDQLTNPNSIVFSPAGVWNDKILLNGRVDTVSEGVSSQELMRYFRNAIRSHFKKVRAFYVGPAALEWLAAGRRLTGAEQSPKDFDLKPED